MTINPPDRDITAIIRLADCVRRSAAPYLYFMNRHRQVNPPPEPITTYAPFPRLGGVHRPISDSDPPNTTSWCVPAAELQDLVHLLASPAVIPIIRQLAVAPCQQLDLCTTASPRPGDPEAAEAALARLKALRLVDRTDPNSDHAQAWWQLTASGRDLLEPLAGLAIWYDENREQLEASSGRSRVDHSEDAVHEGRAVRSLRNAHLGTITSIVP